MRQKILHDVLAMLSVASVDLARNLNGKIFVFVLLVSIFCELGLHLDEVDKLIATLLELGDLPNAQNQV